ncbi:MAG: MBL fold metallo-hydrolase [gamma proteobacterium symbiont of Taylorina sp.]|nr:MBL fold metallo-hydrolase [gamma proteobacterium symbiont of Taylorina sp.]
MLKLQIIPVTNYEQNCSLIWCDQTNQAALIDPGGDVPVLLSTIENNKLDLTQIWLTHGHFDHISGCEEIASAQGIKIIGPHQDDLFLLNALTEQCEMFDFPIVNQFISDQWLSEGDILNLGKEQFEILQTPGHTPGHIAIIHHATKTVWVGDVLFKQSIGRTDLPGGNYADLIASIKNKLFTLPDDYQFVPGHGSSGLISDEKQHNPFLQDRF